MIYFHLALLLLQSLIISSLCNAMNESFSLVRSFSTKKDIIGVGFPTNDTVLTLHSLGWSTFCSKTGKQKINITNNDCISDFALNKNGKIAIVDRDNLTIHNIETGEIIYKKVMPGLKRVAFCSDNDTLGVYNCNQDSITIHTIRTDEEEKYKPPYVELVLFAGNPTNKEFIMGNKIVKCVTGNKDARITYLRDVTASFPGTYNPDGTVIAINKHKDGYLFHKRNCQEIVIDNNYILYYSIAFHPKKRFAALLTHYNNIEFWDYTKKTKKPLAIIRLPSNNKQSAYFYDNRPTTFAPDGKKLAVIIAGGNRFYIVPTPKAAYYDDATKAQCVAFNWAIKNRLDLPFIFIPQDIVKLITHKLSRIPDFQLPKPTAQ